MQYLGAVKTKTQALKQGAKIAKQKNRLFVWEKAKCGLKGKYKVCYRGWLDRDIKSPLVVSMEEWKRDYPTYKETVRRMKM